MQFQGIGKTFHNSIVTYGKYASSRISKMTWYRFSDNLLMTTFVAFTFIMTTKACFWSYHKCSTIAFWAIAYSIVMLRLISIHSDINCYPFPYK